jgi:hypothetical protein
VHRLPVGWHREERRVTAAAKTPSQRGRSNRNRGLNAERDLCKWLRTNGFPGAERAVRTGFRTVDRTSADPGDVMGSPGIVWSVKDCAVEQRSVWMAELEAMDDRPIKAGGDEPIRLLVHKRRGHADPGKWWCWMRAHQMALLLDDGDSSFVFPVRAELGDIVPLLRIAGYGDPIEVAS